MRIRTDATKGALLGIVLAFAMAGGATWGNCFACASNLVFLAALLTTLLYFFFSVRAEGHLVRVPMRVGRMMLMVCLGAMFGNTVMTRMAYLLERLQFLYDTVQSLFARG